VFTVQHRLSSQTTKNDHLEAASIVIRSLHGFVTRESTFVFTQWKELFAVKFVIKSLQVVSLKKAHVHRKFVTRGLECYLP